MSTPIWIAVLVVAVVAVAAFVGLAVGRVTLRPGEPAGQAPAHAVLLPEHPRAADVDRLRLATAVPGYQRDQVDEVLLRLRDALADAERRLAEAEPGADGGGPDAVEEGAFGASARNPR